MRPSLPIDPPPAEPVARAPLLWLALPLLAGYALGHVWPTVAPTLLGMVSAALAVGAAVSAWMQRPLVRALGRASLVLAVIGLAWGWWNFRWTPPPEDWANLPPREAILDLRIERTFSSLDRTWASGLARVTDAPRHLADLTGRNLFYRVDRLPAEVDLRAGASVRVRGILTANDRAAPFGDFAGYLAGQQVDFCLERGRLEAVLAAPAGRDAWFAAQRERVTGWLARGAPEGSVLADLFAALALGRKDLLATAEKEHFIATGTFHLFAISGLHIGLLAMVFAQLLALTRAPPWLRAPLGLLLLAFYVLLTAAPPSAQRAWVLVAAFWLGRTLTRPPQHLSAVLLAALILLVADPRQLVHVGFQLSFAVFAGIILVGIPLGHRWVAATEPFTGLPRPAWRWYHEAWDGFRRFLLRSGAVSLAATLFSAPLVLATFHVATPGGVLLNIVLVPLTALVLSAAVASMLSALFFVGPLTVLFNHAGYLILAVMRGLIEAVAPWRGLFFPLRLEPAWLALAATMILLLLTLVWPRRDQPAARLLARALVLLTVIAIAAGLHTLPLS